MCAFLFKDYFADNKALEIVNREFNPKNKYMKKVVLVSIVVLSAMFLSCFKEDEGSSSSLNLPDGGIGFTKDGNTIVLSDCYYTPGLSVSLIKTDDPKIVHFD